MTTTYRMAIEVQAWRVASDGSLPEEERAAMQDRVVNLRRVQGEFSDEEMAVRVAVADIVRQNDPEWPYPQRSYDHWYWWGEELRSQRAVAGDWVVIHRYGVEKMEDEQFRECCTEVADA